MSADRPNIVFVMSDELRYDCLGYTSDGFVKTPGIDALARGGAFFEKAFVSTPLCVPSRVSMFTGKYSHSTGVSDNTAAPMADPLDTMADMFRRAGYATALCGKNHLFTDGELANRFDHVVEYGHTGRISPGGHPLEKEVVKNKWAVFNEYGAIEEPFPVEVTPNARITDEAIDYLGGLDGSKPFFLWLSYVDPHGPIMAPKPYCDMYDPESMREWPVTENEFANKPLGQRLAREGDLISKIDAGIGMNRFRAIYNGMVSYVSDQVGRFVEYLDAQGLRENTIIVFTSDHGDHQGNHGLSHKSNTLYDDLIHVPFLINCPGRVPAGDIADTMVDLIDLMPTLLDFAGIDVPADTDGRSLAPLLAGETDRHRDAVFGEYGFAGPPLRPEEVTDELRREIRETYAPECHRDIFRGRFRSIRTMEWKYVHYASGEREFYDLGADPLEHVNMAGDAAHGATEEALRAQLLEWSIAATDPLP